MAVKTNSGNTWVTAAWITITTILLLTPLIAMQFSDEVNWTVSDFAFAGAVLVGAGILYELAARAGGLAYQAAAVLALGASVLSLWVTGAVGIIGDEGNLGNLLYVGLVGLAILGSLAARGRAAKMAWVMGVVAIGELLVPAVAYMGVADPRSAVLAPEVFGAGVILTGMWAGSAWLFRQAARDQKPSNAA